MIIILMGNSQTPSKHTEILSTVLPMNITREKTPSRSLIGYWAERKGDVMLDEWRALPPLKVIECQ